MQVVGQNESKKRSEQRQKGRRITYRMTPTEYEELDTAATREGLSIGAFIRARTLAAPTTRAVRRPVVQQVILSKLVAELGRSGNNLNQLARAMNSGETRPLDNIQAALREHRQILAAVIEALGRQPR